MDRKLEAQTVIATVDTLRRRIEERFPEAGLAKACTDLVRLGEDVAAAVQIVSRPYPWLRIGIGMLLALGLAAQVFLATTVELRSFVDEDLRFTNLSRQSKPQ